MTYEAVDLKIQDWIRRNDLHLFTFWSGREARFAYVSSEAGECFQISIEPPADGRITVYARCVEGRTDNDQSHTWSVEVENLGKGLDRAFETVVGWMTPSARHFPRKNPN
jgi:hypothetical protein